MFGESGSARDPRTRYDRRCPLGADARVSDVRSVSATPSYWRRLITLGSPADLSSLRLQQITVGGEIADQNLLDAESLLPRGPAGSSLRD